MRIGIIGSSDYHNSPKIKQILQKLKETYGNTAEIVSGGNRTGIEQSTKKIALEMGFQFKEFNPAYTAQTGYSALNEEYYDKKWHPTHDVGRYRRLVDHCNAIVIFSVDSDKIIAATKKYAEKTNKKIVLINS